MTTSKWFACAGLAAAIFTTVHAEIHCPGNAAGIRTRLIEHAIAIVPVILNDSGPYDFVLDTAAQITAIDPELAAELRLKLLGEARVTGAGFSTRAFYARPDSLRVGTSAMKDPLLFVHNLGQVQITDPRVRGILGQNFLQHFDLLIDYGRSIVCLDAMKQMKEKIKGERIPLVATLHPESNLPFTEPLMIPVRVTGRQTLLLQLDSGINIPLLFAVAKVQSASFTSAATHIRGTDGVLHAYTALPPQDIMVGSHNLRRIPFIAPLSPGKDIPDSEIDGVLPTALFERAFISYADRFAVLEPR